MCPYTWARLRQSKKVYFHRGHALRPELDQFRRGIQKCQEAIENSVGGKHQSEYNIYTLKNLSLQSRDAKASFRRTFGKSPKVQGINKLKLRWPEVIFSFRTGSDRVGSKYKISKRRKWIQRETKNQKTSNWRKSSSCIWKGCQNTTRNVT